MAILYQHLFAVSQVDTIVIPIGAIEDIKSAEHHICALMERESPSSAVSQMNTLYADILTIYKIEKRRTNQLAWALTTLIVIGIDTFASMVKTINGQCQSQTLSIDSSLSCNSNIKCIFGDDETKLRIVFPFIASRLLGFHLIIIIRRCAAKYYSTFFEMQLYATLQFQLPCVVFAFSKDYPSAFIYQRLQSLGIHVWLCIMNILGSHSSDCPDK